MENIIHIILGVPTIIIAAISLIFSIIVYKKNNKQNCEYREKMQAFENEKEKMHQKEREIDEIYMRIKSRSNLIPCFHLVLDNSKIEKINYNGSERIKLVIGLINIGKESASNVKIYPRGNGAENYLETLHEKENSYFVHDYLNQYYAMPKDCITFSVLKEIPKDNDGKILNFIKFKIRFRDLLGNLYEQEFKFGYDNYMLNGFNLDSSSSVPILIEE